MTDITVNDSAAKKQRLLRDLRVRQRTPAWADLYLLSEVYFNRPEGTHVDHIVPIIGWTIEGYRVNGLHVEYNLQYLTEAENCVKHNRMRPEDHAIAEGTNAPIGSYIEKPVVTPGLREALRRAGSPARLAEKLGVSRQAVSKWESVPTRHIIAIEQATGVHRSLLRPDLYVEPGQKINL